MANLLVCGGGRQEPLCSRVEAEAAGWLIMGRQPVQRAGPPAGARIEGGHYAVLRGHQEVSGVGGVPCQSLHVGAHIPCQVTSGSSGVTLHQAHDSLIAVPGTYC